MVSGAPQSGQLRRILSFQLLQLTSGSSQNCDAIKVLSPFLLVVSILPHPARALRIRRTTKTKRLNDKNVLDLISSLGKWLI
ncbi:hypothetical protein Cob_v001710 [Colletotrichum orbiculare MAFF 240422]|uniref:Uncharacterized protein n=1 Tax=Colletotrichum orbiculare (strain 104-T / ATCC 96160 / CBS 514.97 / LARS 414 / MAFF 240422) TaxID=1213857 RepID=A0A484G4R7_COLOR|nr:hypothetical protein Cob_v001710 [Colletotrichum orbiculare MAFF 240422]